MTSTPRRPLTVGLPRLHHEASERRDFLPSLVAFLDRLNVSQIVLEDGYGSGMNVAPIEYLSHSGKARYSSEAECYQQDVVVLLRCPSEVRLKWMRPSALLVAMLHLDTRPARVRALRELELQAISLDLVQDDLGRRLVENLNSVAANGVREAVQQLLLNAPRLKRRSTVPLRMTVLGAGAVGCLAARAGARYGDEALRAQLRALGAAGVEVTLVDTELAGDREYLAARLELTDLLVDATRRSDQSLPVVPNALVGVMPPHAVILDLSADPYDFAVNPHRVKAIEGVPHGNLDQFIFHPGDPAFAQLGPGVARDHQRTALSCYSWPGIEPRPCMEVYSKQIEPVLRAAIDVGVRDLDPVVGTWAERATLRACLSQWELRS